jgi:hypothetical protein
MCKLRDIMERDKNKMYNVGTGPIKRISQRCSRQIECEVQRKARRYLYSESDQGKQNLQLAPKRESTHLAEKIGTNYCLQETSKG